MMRNPMVQGSAAARPWRNSHISRSKVDQACSVCDSDREKNAIDRGLPPLTARCASTAPHAQSEQ
eukprot:8840844-Pyramimonas_sp.AAC.1